MVSDQQTLVVHIAPYHPLVRGAIWRIKRGVGTRLSYERQATQAILPDPILRRSNLRERRLFDRLIIRNLAIGGGGRVPTSAPTPQGGRKWIMEHSSWEFVSEVYLLDSH